MDIKVKGGQVISGEITPSGSKNSSVALIPATILFDKPVVLKNVPEITDVDRLIKILQKLGSHVKWDKEAKTLHIDNSNLNYEDLDKEDLGNMKGTSLLWGPMLARFGKVSFNDLPGGCTLGFRTLGPHYEAFNDLGVRVSESVASAKMDSTKTKATSLLLTEMSPTATENVIMLATSIKGKVTIHGAASEPQVQDLCTFLNKCGAKISGIGSNIIEIEGGRPLKPVEHELLSDHYEIATFLAIAAATGGTMKVHNALPELFKPILNTFSDFGISINYQGTTAILEKQEIIINNNEGKGNIWIKAQPWPALPVDALPMFIPMALTAKKGQVIFHNWMYETGLFWTSELTKLGANIIMADPHRVIVTAGNKLRGGQLEAPYIIRAVVAMAVTAMAAEGGSIILNADALYRGHPNFVQNLRSMGAIIEETI